MKQHDFALLISLVLTTSALADQPGVVAVAATQNGGAWRFDVTLAHSDTGWDHYADGWRVLDNDGKVLATRALAHPHVNEQPFTRSQSGIFIPDVVTTVYIQVSDNVSGWYDTTVPYTLP